MYIGGAFCYQLGLQICSASQISWYLEWAPLNSGPKSSSPYLVKLADGSLTSPLGVVDVLVHYQRYKAKLQCVVLDHTDDFDLIPGDAWLHNHHAVIDYAQEIGLLRHQGQHITLHFEGR